MSLIYNGTTVDSIIYNGTSLTSLIYNGTEVWSSTPVVTYQGLTFTANTAGSTVAIEANGTSTQGQNFSYSTDATTWNTFMPGSTTVILANAGDKVYFKGNNPSRLGESYNIYYRFIMTGSIAASGNIMSLIDDGACTTTTVPYKYCFYHMFYGCAALTSAPELPATTLTQSCYEAMFQACTGLTITPELPATNLGITCYGNMFASCTALTTITALPSTGTIPLQAYYNMFKGCTALTTVPALPGTALRLATYAGMFYGCTSLYVSSTPILGVAEQAWTIPSTGTFTATYAQSGVFTNCLGTRSSDNLAAEAGQSYTYYTQNAPIS